MENRVRGLADLKDTNFYCEVCKINKFRRSIGSMRSEHPLELFFVDVWGPCRTVRRNRERYFLSIMNDHSRRVSVYPMRLKSDVFDIVKSHITQAGNFLGRKVKNFKSDNGIRFLFCNFSLTYN